MKIVILLTWFCFLYVCFRKLNLLKADFSKDDNNGEGRTTQMAVVAFQRGTYLIR